MNVPSAHRHHATQKPVELLRQLDRKEHASPMKSCSIPSAASAARASPASRVPSGRGDTQARRYLLFELNPDFVAHGRGALGHQQELLERDPVDWKQASDAPKQRPALRTNRVRAKGDRSLAFDF